MTIAERRASGVIEKDPSQRHVGAWIGAGAVVLAAVITAAATMAADGDDPNGGTGEPASRSPSSGAGGQDPPATPSPSETKSAPVPASPANQYTAVYSGKRIRVIAPGKAGSLYMAVVDLDRPKVDVMLETEWEDGSAARLGYDLALDWRGGLHSSGPWKRSSKAGAPRDPAACLEAARTADDGSYVLVDELASGDVLCIESSDGKVAQARFISFTPSDLQPVAVTFNVSLWAN